MLQLGWLYGGTKFSSVSSQLTEAGRDNRLGPDGAAEVAEGLTTTLKNIWIGYATSTAATAARLSILSMCCPCLASVFADVAYKPCPNQDNTVTD